MRLEQPLVGLLLEIAPHLEVAHLSLGVSWIAPRLEPLLHVGVGAPAVKADLVPAHVEHVEVKLGCEGVQHVLKQSHNKIIHSLGDLNQDFQELYCTYVYILY